jgi:hypothetical protein
MVLKPYLDWNIAKRQHFGYNEISSWNVFDYLNRYPTIKRDTK